MERKRDSWEEKEKESTSMCVYVYLMEREKDRWETQWEREMGVCVMVAMRWALLSSTC